MSAASGRLRPLVTPLAAGPTEIRVRRGDGVPPAPKRRGDRRLYALGMVDHRVAAPAGFWLVAAGIFAINGVVAAGNGSGLMAFFAVVVTVAALWAAWLALPKYSRSQQP